MLRTCMVKAAGSQTAYKTYDKNISPLHNHCGCVSYTIQRILGGAILRSKVNGITHYWNKLPNGSEIDLTSDQFGGDGYLPVVSGVLAPVRKTVNPRYGLFYQRVVEELAK